MQERFFILGCQRTGTTLMRLVLETHPDVFCYDELKAYAILQNSVLEPVPCERLIGFKIPRWTEQLTYPVLHDDGPEGPCDNFYRGEKLIFLLRDVRDTISSMLKLKAGESNWCEIWVARIIEAKTVSDKTFLARYSAEWDVIEKSGKRLAGLAALYWKYKTDSVFSYRAKGFPAVGVSYDHIVTNPRAALQSVCAHLEIPFHENLLRHGDFPHTELFANGLTLGNTDPKNPIGSASVGQWTRFLSEEDRELIERVSGDLPARVAALFKSADAPNGG